MNAKSKTIKSDLKKVDAHTVKSDEYDELPELTEEMFARAIYKTGGVETPASRRRGPQKTQTKVAFLDKKTSSFTSVILAHLPCLYIIK